MQAWQAIEGIAAPLAQPDINTDDIFPGPAASPVLRGSVGGAGMSVETAGINAFAAWRLHGDGTPKEDFVLNRPPFDRAVILLGGDNFGCGSSRELAVWALKGIGLRCIIAPSFGDIFYDNCIKNGVLPARIDAIAQEQMIAFLTHAADPILRVDLDKRVISTSDATFAFLIAEYPRTLLMDGVDEIDAALADPTTLDAFEARYARENPWFGALSDRR